MTNVSFPKGALVRKNVSDKIVELALVTETVFGVALEEVSDGASLGVQTDKVSVTPVQYTDTERTNKTIKVWFATTDVNGTSPTAGHVGTKCAIALDSGEWYLDISDTANQDVEVVKVDTVRGEFIVTFLDAVIQS